MHRWRIGGVVLWLIAVAGCTTAPKPRSIGPWNLDELGKIPTARWGVRTGWVQEVYYQGEPLSGRPTRVFAYLGRPESSGQANEGKRPAMVLVHGGGGKAFREWAEHWARRGYVSLAMDLAGNGPQGRLPDGGPDQADAVKFREFGDDEVREMWTYHAVAAVLRGHSLLRGLPEVDAGRVGITGISWGGYLTCIAAGLDERLKVAVPVYGCGFLGENSVWRDGSLAAMSGPARERWLRWFDPSAYLERVQCPILFLNGTTDFAYPLDSYQKSYRLVPERFRHLSVVVDLPHGHIWTFPEVDAFVDAALTGGERYPRVIETTVTEGVVRGRVRSARPVSRALLCYTTDEGPWQKRAWKTLGARVDGDRVMASLPEVSRLVGFLAVTDARGLRVSGEHFTWGTTSSVAH